MPFLRRRLGLLALAALAAACLEPTRDPASQLPATAQAALADISERIAAEVEADGVGGMTVAVADKGLVLWSESHGWADPELEIPAERGTVYRTGSISKSVTAVLMAILVQDGVVELDQPLSELVPEIAAMVDRPQGASPTLRQVASHTAGFAREPGLAAAATGPIEGWTSRILESIPTTAYRTPPGAEYSYSNIGYGILGFGLERAAGAPFMDQVKARIFGPAGMTSSTFVVDDDLRPALARGHANGPDGVVNTERPRQEHAGRGYKVPNGGVYSTVDDLARFAAGVLGSLLDDPVRSEVLAVQTPEDPDSGYGLGFSVRRVEDRVFAGHGGSVAGYTAHLLFEPATGLTSVLLRNYNRGRTNLGGTALELLLAVPPVSSEG